MDENEKPPPKASGQHPRRIARPRLPRPIPDADPGGDRASRETTQASSAASTPPPVPRHRPDRLTPGMELREVVRGQRTKSPYVRVLTTEARGGFRRRASGVLEAMPEATRPRGALARLYGRIKSLLLGTPLSTARLAHERLSKVKALAVFSSDALSSSAYATEEILIVLVAAGAGALGYSIPIALAIVALLAIVVLSYRQTIPAYPNGGGAYVVAKENLGEVPGMVAAASLLVGYILTVSVSVAAGVAAISSAAPELDPYRVPLGVGAIVLVTLLNLRGITESATIFAFPTYAFILLGLSLVVVGAIRVATGSAEAVIQQEQIVAVEGLSVFLILRAFTQGSGALTGVEATANGVPSFKPPEARNAATTLLWMAIVLATLFFGFTLLAYQYEIHPSHSQTVVSQLGREIFGVNVVYYLWQAATAMILLLAANTSYAGFPALASVLAKDNYMPRQFAFRGDRLAFSNGIIVLAVASIIFLAAFDANVNRLIPLYALGVFVSFTLSQGGMILHWRRHHVPGWRRSLAINTVGATTTLVVVLIILLTKFVAGAWMSVLIGALLVLFFRAVNRHYHEVDRDLRLPALDTPLPVISRPQTVLVPVRDLNRASVRALAYARSISDDVTALHVTDDLQEVEKLRDQWDRWSGNVPLVIIESPYRSYLQPLLSYIDSIDDNDPETLITVVLPEFVPNHWWQTPLHNQGAFQLKAALLFRRNTVVIDVPQHLGELAEVRE